MAKEKGFPQDLPRTKWYLNDGKIDSKPMGQYFSAPTQSLIQRWLREEKKLLITIDFCRNLEGKYWYVWIVQDIMIPTVRSIQKFSCYHDDKLTYEAALEEAIKETLNLIEIT